MSSLNSPPGNEPSKQAVDFGVDDPDNYTLAGAIAAALRARRARSVLLGLLCPAGPSVSMGLCRENLGISGGGLRKTGPARWSKLPRREGRVAKLFHRE